ncbi:zinc finger protein Xfin-like [Penaeus indicus]|uniref:zinc finger protein Xfin-like n=1 Tax=Penaeus indicus TaxID=29960 RepID=UPI00300C9F22
MSDTKCKLYKCPYCQYTTKKNTNMTAHICIHTGEKPFSCPHCSRRFTQKGNLQSHMYTHTGEKPFACSYCPYRSTQKSNLKSHLFTHHPSEKMVNLDSGGQSAQGRGRPPRPVQNHFNPSKLHRCPYCSYASAMKTNLNNHVRTHTGEKPFLCPHCPLRFSQKGSLQTHIRIHTGEKPYVGLGIDGKSVSRRGITWTEEGHTSKVHQCHYCAYIATTRTNLLNHIRTHTGEKPFACPHCPFRATQKENLKAHIRVHTEVEFTHSHWVASILVMSHQAHVPGGKYSCHECISQLHRNTIIDGLAEMFIREQEYYIKMQRKLTHSYILNITLADGQYSSFVELEMDGYPRHGWRGPQEVDKNHTRTSKMHHCPFCAYSTVLKSNLNRHARIHTGEKPYSCPHCSYQTTSKDNLMKRHVLTHTGEKPFACPYCPYRASPRLGVAIFDKLKTVNKSLNSVGLESGCQWNSSKDVRRNTKQGQGTKVHQCPYCQYSSTVLTNMNRHIRRHTGEKPFSCPHCAYSYRHIQQVGLDGSGQWLCTKALRRNMKSPNTHGKMHQCPFCHYSTAIVTHMKRHVRTHTGEKPFACPHCAYSSGHPLQVELGSGGQWPDGSGTKQAWICANNINKIHKCPYCQYSSLVLNNLKRHMSIHTGEKPFACPHCSYSCTRKGNLETHIRTHTGEKPYSCQHCPYRSSRMFSLKSHMSTHHPYEVISKNSRGIKSVVKTTEELTNKDVRLERDQVWTGERGAPGNRRGYSTTYKIHQCPYCPYSSNVGLDSTEEKNRRRGSTSRMLTSTNYKMYECPNCTYTTYVATSMKNHIRTHTGERPFYCTYCPFSSTTKANLQKHIRTHTGEKPFKQVGMDSDDLRDGRRITGPSMEVPPFYKTHQCPYCTYNTKFTTSLRNHMRTHTGEKPYSCPYCSFCSATKDRLKSHIRTHTGEKPYVGLDNDDQRTGGRGTAGAKKGVPSIGKVMKCPYCAYTTSITTNMKKHARTHTGEKPYACPYCPFRASQTENLKRHIRRHTGEKPFACNFCPYRSTEKSSLKNHIWVHHPSDRHTLQVEPGTDEQAGWRDNLGPEFGLNKGPKSHQCPYCPYNTNFTTHLQNHVRTHTGEKPYQCQYCSLRFAQKGSLRSHILTHTGEKPHACTHCGYRCSRKNTLNAHIRAHHF